MSNALTLQRPLGVGATPEGHTQTQTNRGLSEMDVNCLQAKENYRMRVFRAGPGDREVETLLYPLVTLISLLAFQKSRSFSKPGGCSLPPEHGVASGVTSRTSRSILAGN